MGGRKRGGFFIGDTPCQTRKTAEGGEAMNLGAVQRFSRKKKGKGEKKSERRGSNTR